VHKKHLCKFLFELSEDNRNVEFGSSICNEYTAVYSADNSSIIEVVRNDPPENHVRVWDPVDTTLVILTLVCWIVLLVFCFQKFVDVLAYHSIRNESQIDKNYRKYLHARVQIVKPSERRNAFGTFFEKMKSWKFLVIENDQAQNLSRRSSNLKRRKSELGIYFLFILI